MFHSAHIPGNKLISSYTIKDP